MTTDTPISENSTEITSVPSTNVLTTGIRISEISIDTQSTSETTNTIAPTEIFLDSTLTQTQLTNYQEQSTSTVAPEVTYDEITTETTIEQTSQSTQTSISTEEQSTTVESTSTQTQIQTDTTTPIPEDTTDFSMTHITTDSNVPITSVSQSSTSAPSTTEEITEQLTTSIPITSIQNSQSLTTTPAPQTVQESTTAAATTQDTQYSQTATQTKVIVITSTQTPLNNKINILMTNSPPIFRLKPYNLLVVAGQQLIYPLPLVFDKEKNTVVIALSLDRNQNFIALKNSKIYASPTTLDAGDHLLTLNLTDNGYPTSKSIYKIKLTVVKPVNDALNKSSTSSNSTVKNSTISIPTTTPAAPTYIPSKEVQMLSSQFKASIQSLNKKGEVVIQLNNQVTFNSSTGKFNEIEIQPILSQQDSQKIQNWTVTADYIEVDLFYKDQNNQLIDMSLFGGVSKLLQQLPKQIGKTFYRLSASGAVWSLVNNVQQVSNLALFDLDMPSNAQYFNQYMKDFNTFNVIPQVQNSQQQNVLASRLLEESSSNDDVILNKFKLMGYNSVQLISQLQFILLISAFGIILIAIDKSIIIILSLIVKVRKQSIDDLKRTNFYLIYLKITKGLYYTWFTRLFIEGYMIASIMVFYILKYQDDPQTAQDKLNVALSAFALIVLILTPTFMGYIVICQSYNVQKPNEYRYIDLIELFNEISYLFQQYLCFVFTQFVTSTNVQVEAAWLFCGIVIFIVAGNVFAYVSVIIYEILKFIKIKRQRSQTHEKLEITESNLTLSKDHIRPSLTTFFQKFLHENMEERERELQYKEQSNLNIESFTLDNIENQNQENQTPSEDKDYKNIGNIQDNKGQKSINIMKPNTDILFHRQILNADEGSQQKRQSINFDDSIELKLGRNLKDNTGEQKKIFNSHFKQTLGMNETNQKFFKNHKQKLQNFILSNRESQESDTRGNIRPDAQQQNTILKINFKDDLSILNDNHQDIIRQKPLQKKNTVKVNPSDL
ncbi:UNKNOWN [Stylonychia lemnae]|uniref:TRP C-terminal domain-containing protein n=1 Tax=Stylonychia lemnae TaxID=5949 RepID=A0A078AK79_STYLE|nr:UNKNOWN [Stylonychia lemnae]|eukprot:CDW82301.1 UNKNOWN [Stylonychia lemnae]